MTSITSGASWVSQLSAAAATQNAVDWISANSSDDLSKSLGVKKSAILQNFISNGASGANAFASIAQTQMTGLANLAAQAAITRAQTQVAKKMDALSSDETALPSSIDVNAIARIDLANGSTLDLTTNTFTLRDGTVLDITTGRKVDKLAWSALQRKTGPLAAVFDGSHIALLRATDDGLRAFGVIEADALAGRGRDPDWLTVGPSLGDAATYTPRWLPKANRAAD